MNIDPERISILRNAIIREIYNALGLSRDWFGSRLFNPVLYLPAQRFARRIAQFDLDVNENGLNRAAARLLGGFVERVGALGVENVPSEGPLILAGNHPGAYDGLVVLTVLQREDIHLVISGVDFTRSLPSVSHRFIYVTPDLGIRMQSVRECIRRLQRGAALFIFPTGLVDPDPAVWPIRAGEVIERWSGSLGILLRRVPEARLVVMTTSHVLDEHNLNNPFIRLVSPGWRQRRLAEYIQVIRQLVFHQRADLMPRVSFSTPTGVQELCLETPGLGLNEAVRFRAIRELERHIQTPLSSFTPYSL